MAQIKRFEGIRSLNVLRSLLPRRQGFRGNHLQGVLLAQKLFFAKDLMDRHQRREMGEPVDTCFCAFVSAIGFVR